MLQKFIEKNALESYKNALRCDPISAFGGVLAINSTISKKLANEINKNFFEVIISNGFSIDALKIFKKRKNIRLINIKKFKIKMEESYNFLTERVMGWRLIDAPVKPK